MAGKAGCSGRKGFYDEAMVKKLMAKANNIILQVLEGKDRYKNVPIEVVIEIAARLALKGIPQAIDVENTEKRYLEIVHKLEVLTTDDLRRLINPRPSRALPAGAVGASEVGQVMDKD